MKENKAWKCNTTNLLKISHVFTKKKHEIIQNNSLGWLQKKSSEYIDCLYVTFVSQWRIGKSTTDSILGPQNYFQIVEVFVIVMLLKRIGAYAEKICLNIILRSSEMFLHTGLTEVHIFYLSRSTTFFSSFFCVIFMLVLFLIRMQILPFVTIRR